MVIKSDKNKNGGRVKFISYTGEWPCLCMGVLTLEIDGKEYKFGHDYNHRHYHEDLQTWVQEDEDPNNPNFNSFWSSGGRVEGGPPDWNFEVHTGEWRIDVDDLPEQFRDLAEEIDEVFNSGVIPFGCCGGCV